MNEPCSVVSVISFPRRSSRLTCHAMLLAGLPLRNDGGVCLRDAGGGVSLFWVNEMHVTAHTHIYTYVYIPEE